MNEHFLSLNDTKPQEVPQTVSFTTTKSTLPVFCSFFLFWKLSNPLYIAISLSQFWCNTQKPHKTESQSLIALYNCKTGHIQKT